MLFTDIIRLCHTQWKDKLHKVIPMIYLTICWVEIFLTKQHQQNSINKTGLNLDLNLDLEHIKLYCLHDDYTNLK